MQTAWADRDLPNSVSSPGRPYAMTTRFRGLENMISARDLLAKGPEMCEFATLISGERRASNQLATGPKCVNLRRSSPVRNGLATSR